MEEIIRILGFFVIGWIIGYLVGLIYGYLNKRIKEQNKKNLQKYANQYRQEVDKIFKPLIKDMENSLGQVQECFKH